MSRILLRAAACLASSSLPAAALAQALTVTPVHWVPGDPEIPHDAVNGRATTFKAIAEGGSCGGTYSYRWDLNGDGDFADPGEAAAQASSDGARAGLFAALETRATYPDATNDRLYYARVEVTCGSEIVSATYPVLVRVDGVCSRYLAGADPAAWCDPGDNLLLTRRVRGNAAIDDALWYVFSQLTHQATDAEGRDVHTCWIPGGYPGAYTAAAYLAATRRSHRLGPAAAGDPYFRHLSACALHALVDSLGPIDLDGQTRFEQPVDANGNGIGLRCGPDGGLLACGYGTSYEGGPILETLANFGDPTYRVPTGVEGDVFGRTLAELSQDYADTLAWCLSDFGGGAAGWGYQCDDGHLDNSTNGWPAEALRIVTDKNGVVVPQWLRDMQRAYLVTYCGADGCEYTGRQPQLAGNGLTAWGMVSGQVFDPDDPFMAATLQGVQAQFDASLGTTYDMYATTKGMRAFVPELETLPDGRSWNDLYADWHVRNAQADGHFTGSGNMWDSHPPAFATALGVQILESWLNAQPHSRAFPTRVAPGDTVTFDHRWSHVLDPDHSITRYRWNVIDQPEDDLDGDGRVDVDEMLFELQTADRDRRFDYVYDDDITWGEVRQHAVTLEVVDDLGRRYQDGDSVEIEVSFINHGPVLVTHPDGPDGAYTTHPGVPILLDATGTFDPDEDNEVFPGDAALDIPCGGACRPPGEVDRVTLIAWDLDQDGEFEAESPQAEYTPPEGLVEGNRVAVPIIACDDGQWNGECYDAGGEDCSACTTGTATVRVIPNRDPVASAGGPYRGSEGETLLLDAGGSADPDGLPLTWAWDLDEDGEFDDGTEPQVPYALGGGPADYAVTVRVTDWGGKTAEATALVRVDNAPPQPPRVRPGQDPASPGGGPDGGAGVPRASEGVPYPIDLDSEDPGGDEVVYQVDCDGDGEPDWSGPEGPAWCVFDDNGEQEVTLWTVDEDGGESGRVAVTVPIDNVDPAATLDDAIFAYEGEDVVLAAAALDPGLAASEVVWFGWEWGDGARTEGPLGRHAYADDGDYRVTLTAKDKDDGMGTHPIRVIVSNLPPMVENSPPGEAVVGREYAFAPRVADPGTADTHVFELALGPEAMVLDAASGRLTWTPAAADRAYHDVSLLVRDDDGGVAKVNWTLTVLGALGELPGTGLLTDEEGNLRGGAGGVPEASGCAVRSPGRRWPALLARRR